MWILVAAAMILGGLTLVGRRSESVVQSKKEWVHRVAESGRMDIVDVTNKIMGTNVALKPSIAERASFITKAQPFFDRALALCDAYNEKKTPNKRDIADLVEGLELTFTSMVESHVYEFNWIVEMSAFHDLYGTAVVRIVSVDQYKAFLFRSKVAWMSIIEIATPIRRA